MTWGIVASTAATVVSGYMASSSAADAASQASQTQGQASDKSIAESQRQFNAIQELLKPYTGVGSKAVSGQQALLGLDGENAQSQAINGIATGPQMSALVQQGENALLQNASATGGLRGGNLQGALAQFRPQLLSQLIQQQFSNLGGLTSVGQNAAAMQGNAGQNSSNQIIDALTQQGASQAGNFLAQGKAQSDTWSNLGRGVSTIAGAYGGF